MTFERLDHPAVSLLCGQGRDLPRQAARGRAQWLPGREGRAPVLLVALLWGRECTDVVQTLDAQLDALYADYLCTPAGWSEVQAARQVLAALNQQLFYRRRAGHDIGQLNAGLLLLQGDEAQFLQAGAIGLLRYQGADLQCLVGREGMLLGAQAELAVVQQCLALAEGEVLLLAPQALLDVADLHSFSSACATLNPEQLQPLLAPLLQAPGAAVLLLPGAAASRPTIRPCRSWPALAAVGVGQQVDGWRLLEPCRYGPPGRLFRARDERGREAMLWLSEQDADEAFWQREWVLRRSPAANLPQLLSCLQPRQHAFQVFQPLASGMRNLDDWAAAHAPLSGPALLAVLVQLIVAVRALQRRGMQGLWLDPGNILVGPAGQLLLLPEHAVLLPGVSRQTLPAAALPLAPELRAGLPVDGRADQFALAALAYWLLGGRWPAAALADGGSTSRYVPLAPFNEVLPQGWDGVLARALAPRAEARFEALSEFQLALQSALLVPPAKSQKAGRKRARRLLLAAVLVQLALGLWFGLRG